MNTKQDLNATIEQQLASVNMPQHVRDAVRHDMCIAESIVSAVEWLCGKFKRPNADAFAKPRPKY